jgi:hypothetical protein
MQFIGLLLFVLSSNSSASIIIYANKIIQECRGETGSKLIPNYHIRMVIRSDTYYTVTKIPFVIERLA